MSEPKSIANTAAPTRYSGFDSQYIRRLAPRRSGNRQQPLLGETLAEIVMANRDDLDQAYQAAAKAQKA